MNIKIHNDVNKFFEKLDEIEYAKTLRTLDLLERFGSELGLPHSRHMKDGLLELRIRGKRELRILYCFHKQSAILLNAFVKKSEKTLPRELVVAHSRKNQIV